MFSSFRLVEKNTLNYLLQNRTITLTTSITTLGKKLFENLLDKKMLVTSIFFLSQNIFYPSQNKISIFQLYIYFNPLLHKYSFWHINNRQLLKTLWEKKKLLVTSNFSFSDNVFYSVRQLYHIYPYF